MLARQAFGREIVMDDAKTPGPIGRAPTRCQIAMGHEYRRNPKARDRALQVIRNDGLPICSVSPSARDGCVDRRPRLGAGSSVSDGEGTKIGNALWNGAVMDASAAERIVALMRLTIADARLVMTRRQQAVYLICHGRRKGLCA